MLKRDGYESRKKLWDESAVKPPALYEWAISSEAPNRRTFNDYLGREQEPSDSEVVRNISMLKMQSALYGNIKNNIEATFYIQHMDAKIV